MKKLLSILGSIALTSTTASSVVACSNNVYKTNNNNVNKQEVNHSYDEAKIEASLITRAKSIIVDDQFGLNDVVIKKFALNNNTVGNYRNTGSQDVNDTEIGDDYATLIDDSNLNSVAKKSNINVNGTVGEQGAALPKSIETALDSLIGLLPSAVQKPLMALVPFLINALGLKGDAAEIANTVNTGMQVISKLNSAVALQGIPYALGLIPDLSHYGIVFSAAGALVKALLTKGVVGSIDDAIDGLQKDADSSALGDLALPDAMSKIATIFGNLLPQKKQNVKTDGGDTAPTAIQNIFNFISLTGYYMSFFEHGSKTSILDTLKADNTKKVSESIFYTTAENGKGFNVAPVLNEAAYYLGNGITQDKTLNLLRILFLTSKDGSTITLNDVATKVTPLFLGLIKTINPDTKLTQDDANNLFLDILLNGEDDTDAKSGDLSKTLFGDKPFETIFNDWTKIGTYNDVDAGKAIANNNYLKRLFANDNGLDANNLYGTMSLKVLLEDVPLYKYLMLDSEVNPNHPDNGGYGSDSVMSNNGLLPNYAGHYTQESIAQVASDLDSAFSLNSDVKTNDDIKYQYFMFSDSDGSDTPAKQDDEPTTTKVPNMKSLVDDLISNDTDDDGGQDSDSILSFLLSNIAGKPSNIKDATVQAKIAKRIGYYVGGPNDATPGINANYVKVNSWMGQLLMLLVPSLKDVVAKNDKTTLISKTEDGQTEQYIDGTQLPTYINSGDNLKFFAGAVSKVVSDLVKPTDYSYWMMKVLENVGLDNQTQDNSVWYYDNVKNPIWGVVPNYGIYNTQYFKGTSEVQSMTLSIKFNLANMPWLVDGTTFKPDQSYKPSVYTFTISRSEINEALSFTQIDKKQ